MTPIQAICQILGGRTSRANMIPQTVNRKIHSNIIRPQSGLIYGEYLTLALDVTRRYSKAVPRATT
jgi:hypothetical protein